MFSILLFLNKVLEPYGLKIIGRMVGLMGLFGLIVQPLWQLGKFFYMPGRMHKVKRYRVIASLAVVAALVAVFLFVPLPFHLTLQLRRQTARRHDRLCRGGRTPGRSVCRAGAIRPTRASSAGHGWTTSNWS